jgi:hypothetical protein
LAIAAVLIAVPRIALAQAGKGEIDWTRRVLVGHGQGAPDLNAPSVAVARLGAERAAKLDAYRNALETLKGMQLQSGGNVGTLLQNDQTLTGRIDGKLKGVKPIKTHYYSDGGVSLDIEVPLDELPAEIARVVKVPAGVPPLKAAGEASAGGGQTQPQAQPQGQGQASGDDIVQTAKGEAAVLAGDKPAAREKAIRDALRHAVEMAAGTLVQGITEVQDYQTKMDKVLGHSTGFVRKYDILSEAMDGDVVQVNIRAVIGKEDLDKDLKAFGLLGEQKGNPRTMVLIAEQNIGMAAPAAVWMKDKGGQNALVSADLRIAENVILDTLKSGGFKQLIDPEIATEKAVLIGGITTDINASQARKLKSLTGAEVILIGKVIATSRGEMGDLGPGWRSCTATISGRAVNTDNGDILSTSETTQNAAQLDDLTCGKEATKKASKIFAQDMIKKIAARWQQDVSGGNEVHLTVHKVKGMKQAREFRTALAQFMRGVRGVNQRRFEGGTQELDVTLVGSTEQFAEELEAKKIGKFSVTVTGVSANTVEAELGQ